MTPGELPRIEIHAEVGPDLHTITGRLALDPALAGAPLADALAALPDPPSDLHALRTFPAEVSHGRVDRDGDAFVARLPERFGPYGATRFGAFANGGWYPQPLADGHLPIAQWDVTVTLPPGVVGVLGDTVGTGVLRWQGVADRAPLAVVPRARITRAGALVTVTHGRASRTWAREVARAAEGLSGVVVEAPLRRRLVAVGPGLAYVSDRAFRLTPGFVFAHRKAVRAGLGAAFSGEPDPFDRDVRGAALAATERGEAAALLRRFRWVPQVNLLLSSNRIAFWSETTGRTWPADPVADDLTELFDPRWPGAAALAALADARGPEAAADPSAADLDPWRGPPPVQDYRLALGDGALVVTRDVAADAPPEAATVRLDGVDQRFVFPPGTTTLPTTARRVAFDPAGHLSQTSRVRDTLPARYDVTFAGWVDGVNLTRGQLFLGGATTLRRQWDTRNLVIGSLANSQVDLVAARVGYLRKVGPLLDGYARPLRARADVGASVLDPRFAETDGLALAADTVLSLAWDDRVSADFPLRGRRFGGAVGAGALPATDETWANASISALALASPHPRVAFAARGAATSARSGAPHRLLLLGGPNGLRAIPALPACGGDEAPCLPVATDRAVGVAEVRTAPFRNLSVPGLLAWGSEVQVTVGVEALAARVDGRVVTGSGLTVTVLGLAELLGVETTGLGLTAAYRIGEQGLGLGPGGPELYLAFGPSF